VVAPDSGVHVAEVKGGGDPVGVPDSGVQVAEVRGTLWDHKHRDKYLEQLFTKPVYSPQKRILYRYSGFSRF
jgi:hypothetical protein